MKRITVLVATAVLLSGCAATEEPAPPSADPPTGVTVSLGQWRSDEVAHRLQVAVRNTTDTPVHFSDLQLVTPDFATVPPEPADATIKRTERTDLPIPFGAANCSPGGLPGASRPATVVAHLRAGSEPLRKVVFSLPASDPLLSRLLRDECSEFLIKQAADISFGPEWKRDGKDMRATLVLTRRGPGTVTVNAIDGTSHYIVTPEHERRPLITLDANAQRTETPIVITPGRCDPHAFAEAKKAFLFPVRATVDGGVERVLIVQPPKPQQDHLIDYALEVCGLGG
ncbi:hypothetical protein [Nonomuraea sp. NPDC048916]|uniref:hypothetical protein n=1 Tax=Nonomuraea sp. NPDC048916 TaxID=3154232 RepID=UPI0033E261E1